MNTMTTVYSKEMVLSLDIVCIPPFSQDLDLFICDIRFIILDIYIFTFYISIKPCSLELEIMFLSINYIAVLVLNILTQYLIYNLS